MYTISPATVKYADRLACEKYGIDELTLMKNASRACFDYIYPQLQSDDKIVIICGKGGNGGDGYELARILHKEWFDVTVINAFDCDPVTEASKKVFCDCKKDGVRIVSLGEFQSVISDCNVIIDALFGVGFYGCIENESTFGKMLEFANKKCAKRIAIDTPSGINSLDGKCEGVAFKADLTITFEYIKTGMLSYPARDFCGKIVIAGVGYPESLRDETEKDALVCDDDYVRKMLPERKPNTHKGTYGRLLMYVGSPAMTGAAILCAMGALRSGAGLVNIARDKETIRTLKAHLTEPIFSVLSQDEKETQMLALCQKATALLIGCGMGKDACDRDVLYSLIKCADCNLIIDADGINLLCENKHILKEAKKTPVLTPHPLEFARLIGKTCNEVQGNRISYAKEFAKEYGCVLVLKGASTVIASPCGEIAINTSGNPGLAKGGSGDVLAGVISSFISQGIDVFTSATLGVYLHGRAADILKEEISEYGLLPSDIPMAIARLLP